MNLRSISRGFVFFSFIVPQFAICQSYIADTLVVDIQSDTSKKFEHSVNVSDIRGEDPNFVSIYEKKKWLFFPVDQIIYTSKPLTTLFQQNFTAQTVDLYQLDIYEFYLNHNESMFNRSLSLEASLQLSKVEKAGDTVLLGTFYYEDVAKFKRNKAIEFAYSDVLKEFKTDFLYDLGAICSDSSPNFETDKYHFRKGFPVAQKNLYISTDLFYGIGFWGFDAELWFSSPEPAQKFTRNSSMFRYLNYGNRQSVALSAGVSQFNYRVNQKWLFQNKSAFLLGFNKWTDVDEAKRTIEEIFLFQLTATQRICFNHLDKAGITFGVGLIEEFSYMIYNDPIFSVGLVLSCAYKF